MTLLELLPFALVAVAFWLLILRPAKARRDEQAALLARLAPGQRVMTTAGVFGTLTAVDSAEVNVEIAPGVVIAMVPQAIGRIVTEPGPDDVPPSPAPAGSTDAIPEADRG
jgi:preprotein translocase subunit YajC